MRKSYKKARYKKKEKRIYNQLRKYMIYMSECKSKQRSYIDWAMERFGGKG